MNYKIAFIVPALPEVRVTKENRLKHNKLFTLPYLGVLMLAAMTPENYEVRLINEHVDPLDFDAIDSDLVGITVMTPMAPRAYEIADELRKRGKIVILGGMHPTYLPHEALEHADSVVQGEAEEIWPVLLSDFEIGKLRKIYEKNKPFELSSLPFPKRELIQSLNNPVDVIQATRGCPYRCNFCSIHNFHDNTFRMRPVDKVIEELSSLKGVITAFVDDNIVGRHDWAKELFEAMIPLKKKWISMASLSIAHDEELLRLAKLSGCMGFFVGLETINDDNLVDSNKFVNRSLKNDYKKHIAKMHKHGLGISAGTVYGFDHDTTAVFPTMLDFAKEVRLNVLQVSPLTPFPGTQLYEQFKKEGRDLDPDWAHYDFYNVAFTPKQMTRQELLDGMNYIRNSFYAPSSVFKRVMGNAYNLGLYSTVFNFFLNYSYRRNQKKGFHYPP
jgi:radical SAM superfamily enzyme YgiQ (UPF0313 family)